MVRIPIRRPWADYNGNWFSEAHVLDRWGWTRVKRIRGSVTGIGRLMRVRDVLFRV